MDNSQCSRAVKSFKIKLHREIGVFSKKENKTVVTKAEYIKQFKQGVDIKAREKGTRTLTFQVPSTEEHPAHVTDPEFWHPLLQANATNLAPSHYEGIFTIHYKLDIFVKHQSTTEFGQGRHVTFPIKIKQSSNRLQTANDYQKQLLNAFIPQEFEP